MIFFYRYQDYGNLPAEIINLGKMHHQYVENILKAISTT